MYLSIEEEEARPSPPMPNFLKILRKLIIHVIFFSSKRQKSKNSLIEPVIAGGYLVFITIFSLESTMSETIEFTHTIDAKLASKIGEESISSPIQAIAEINKNAYDADAHNCWITFEGNPIHPLDVGSVRKISKIIIRDDGFGMTLEDLQNKFFRIGTDNKQRNTISPENNRRVVGEKGMGHVAIKRLGNVCKIISNPRSYPEIEDSVGSNAKGSSTLLC